jgi:phosphate transport system substrate-binding protein
VAGTRRRGRRSAVTARAAQCLAAAVALGTLAAACGTAASPAPSAQQAQAAGQVAISETGSSLLYPLMHSWAAAYQRQTPGVTVTTAATSSGTGIAAATAGSTDLGASDAYLSSGDLVKKPALRNIPLAVSAQTVLYNLPGVSAAGHVRLNGTVLAGIYDGTITSWDDPRITALNPQLTLPPVKIVPVERSDSSGDTFLFTSYLSTQDAAWNSAVGYGTIAAWPRLAAARMVKGSTGVLQACASAPGCVAYNGISYLSQARQAGLGEAALANAGGRYTLPEGAAIAASADSFVSLTPASETISMIDGPSATGYPIVNYEYAVVSTSQRDAARAAALKAFLRWIITTGNGAGYLNQVGFQPLPPALVALGEQQIGEIGP